MTSTDQAVRSLPSGERLVVSRFGGQVLSWQAADGHDLLYLSPMSTGAGGKPVRGGIPVCFPQFGSRGALAKHGFARTRWWTEVHDVSGAVVHMQLADDEQTRLVWPHRFTLDLWASLAADSLTVAIAIQNTDAHAWSFTAALHSYLKVDDVSAVTLTGLQGLTYEDALLGGKQAVAHEECPNLDGAIDRIYYRVPDKLVMQDANKSMEVSQTGFGDVVVWNPGTMGSSQLGDMPAGDEPKMLCVEAGQIMSEVTLQPGERWDGSQKMTPRVMNHSRVFR